MPYLRIQTNAGLSEERAKALLAAATRVVSSGLGKPEAYVMIALEPERPLMFAGTMAPAAILELFSIGLEKGQTGRLSDSLCSLMEEQAEVAKDRVFIIFASVDREMWGWNATTF